LSFEKFEGFCKKNYFFDLFVSQNFLKKLNFIKKKFFRWGFFFKSYKNEKKFRKIKKIKNFK
jgi:hypothetical protein